VSHNPRHQSLRSNSAYDQSNKCLVKNNSLLNQPLYCTGSVYTVGVSSVGQLDEADDSRDAEVHGPPRVRFSLRPRTSVLFHFIVALSTAVGRQTGSVRPIRVRLVADLKRRLAQRHFVQNRVRNCAAQTTQSVS